MTVAIYPGSFDPITNGHIDVVARGARLFSRLIIGVYDTPEKNLLFTLDERMEMVRQAVAHISNVGVEPYSGLTVDFARKVQAQAIVRGLRVSADFEHEFDMAMMNRRLGPELELVCLLAHPEYQFLSSSLLKEVARLGANIKNLIPEHVAQALKEKEG
jgi:pantetheine-phosphate adenylyltransferase